MHTVIIGGGFAGVKAALEISKKQLGKITLISNEPYFLYHAALYATATGRDVSASAADLQDMFALHHDVDVVQDTVTSLDPARKLVIGEAKQYPYENLVIALGVVTTYFNISGMDQHSFGIKTLGEAKHFKQHLHSALAADQHMDRNYVVVGGGLTGVELAGALGKYLREIASAHKVKRAKISISLVEAAPRLVPRLSKTASKKVQARLESLGIKVLVNSKVESLDKDTIVVQGKKIPTHTAIWTSGVTNHPFFKDHPLYFNLAKNGRVTVDPYFEAYKDIYVIGDNADIPTTGTAHNALHNAVFIAEHLARKTTHRPFRAYDAKVYPDNIPVGDGWAYVEKHGVYVAGRSGHWLRRMIELRALRSLLPPNQAMSAWRAYDYYEEDSCDICSPVTTDS